MQLRCEECEKEAATAEEARGWRALYATDPRLEDLELSEEPIVVAFYCPVCAKREFDMPPEE